MCRNYIVSILAQVITERLSLVRKDANFHKYPVEGIW